MYIGYAPPSKCCEGGSGGDLHGGCEKGLMLTALQRS